MFKGSILYLCGWLPQTKLAKVTSDVRGETAPEMEQCRWNIKTVLEKPPWRLIISTYVMDPLLEHDKIRCWVKIENENLIFVPNEYTHIL